MAPWSFRGYLVAIKMWDPEQALPDIDFSTSQMWIQAFNLPVILINNETAKKIGDSIGVFIKADLAKESYKWRKFLRIRVELNLLAPLKESIPLISESGKSIQVKIRSPFGNFRSSRGIRQGDPLSPYLFIIYFDLLSRIIYRAESNALLHGVKACRSAPPISHLMYADDLVIFCHANTEEANHLKLCLNQFSEPDSLEHLFIRCPVAQQVSLVSRNFRLLLFEHCRIDEWLRILLTFDRQLFPSLDLCWEFLTFSVGAMGLIWNSRNKLLFESTPVDVLRIAQLAENLAIEHVKAQHASFKDGKVAAALLVRNSFGAVVFAAAFSDWCHNVVVAEAFAIAKALFILDKTRYQQVLFESDSLLAVNMILHDSIPPRIGQPKSTLKRLKFC
ncbi:hypothetical protein BUALT_Bualt02G0038600 [Buddleja alternifolia]|uniref:Reverse transcriptase domain-containing protein n=1 Tax=Buddleja alternifolia TaxID=168488 RepID=A0AAV6Y1H4_9LAMI|nr:hypothetical protein BUALT_Bualt02G0038600 [Buddleja alternifolia]